MKVSFSYIVISVFFVFGLQTKTAIGSDRAKDGQRGEVYFSLSEQVSASKALSDNVVVVQSNLIFDDSDDTYVTGTILNDSRAGIYDLSISIIYKDNAGRILSQDGTSSWTTSIIGYPAAIYGYDYSDYLEYPNLYNPFHKDFIPPEDTGYFRVEVDIPNDADLDATEAVLRWKWTLKASLLKATASNIRLSGDDWWDHRVDFGIFVSGNWGSNEGIKNLRVYLIGFGEDNIVTKIGQDGLGDDIFYPSNQTNNNKPLVSGWLKFYDISNAMPTEHVKLRVSYELSNDQLIPDIDAVTAFLSVKDTVLSELDMARVSRLKRGDLNEDGYVDFSDFIIFARNFGN